MNISNSVPITTERKMFDTPIEVTPHAFFGGNTVGGFPDGKFVILWTKINNPSAPESDHVGRLMYTVMERGRLI